MPTGARAAAAVCGDARYFTGISCPQGHTAERYVSTGGCVVCLAAKAAGWRDANRNHTRNYAKKRYWQNPNQARMRNRIAYAANPTASRQANLKWHKKNPLGRVIHEANRRARIAKTGGKCSTADVLALRERQKHRCGVCIQSIRRGFHVDHIMPLALGGSNEAHNLQLLCQSCNQRKYAKHPITFAQENGRLL